MKNPVFQTENFRQISDKEAFDCTGGGFAYDVGRLLRFVGIAQGGDMGLASAIADACYNSIQS
jgi:hypothetical protein